MLVQILLNPVVSKPQPTPDDNRPTREPVSPSPTAALPVLEQIPRLIYVHDEPDVGDVDTYIKRAARDDRLDPARSELLQYLVLAGVRYVSVKRFVREQTRLGNRPDAGLALAHYNYLPLRLLRVSQDLLNYYGEQYDPRRALLRSIDNAISDVRPHRRSAD
ncbi:hypothetical protein KC331_g19396 [Hortaea werneckii]|nr:hypothetical protein KC331_g19396 [Hortaea werneckii]